jgi:hypothetical protein
MNEASILVRRQAKKEYFTEAGQWMRKGLEMDRLLCTEPLALACYLRASAIYSYGLKQIPRQHLDAVLDIVYLVQDIRSRIDRLCTSLQLA